MTITASPLSLTRRNAAVSASAWFHTSDPGVFAVTYPTGITGPATVEAAGTRVWRNGLKHGQYLARANCLQSRVNVAWFLEVEADALIHTTGTGALSADVSYSQALIANINYASNRRINYMIGHLGGNSAGTIYRGWYFSASPNNASTEVATNLVNYTDLASGTKRLIITYDGTTVDFYYTTGTARDQFATRSISGTMGGSEYLAIFTKCKFAKMEGGLPSQAQREAFQSAGTLPAGLAASYQGGHEINPAAPVFYDASGNGLDLSDVDVPGNPEAAASGDFTDTGFTSPLVEVPITIAADCTAGVKNITLRRTRVGIPARTPALADAILYDRATLSVTVAVTAEAVTIGPDVDCQVPSYPATFDLLLSGNYDGAATIVSDDANLVPTSPVTIAGGVAVVACTVSADVTGATVTATGPGGDTDACSVTVAEVPEPEELLSIGPDTVAEVESYPAAIVLLLTSNVDGDVDLISDDPNLTVSSPVTVVDGKAEVACLVLADVAGATVTASRTPGPSDSCSVSVSDVLTDDWIAVGPNQRTRIEGKRILWPIRVRSSKDGAFTAVASPPTGIVISGPFILASGACNITAQPSQAGTWTLTVTQDGRTDSVTLEALAAVPAVTPKVYDLTTRIDAFFEYVSRKYGYRPRFTPTSVQDVRAPHSTQRTYARFSQGSPQAGAVFGAIALSYKVIISYTSTSDAENDLGVLREEADRYDWQCIGFSMSGQTMFEAGAMEPRLTLDLNYDILPTGR